MQCSRLDVIYRKILLTKFFIKGWGSPKDLIRLFRFRKLMSKRDRCYKLVPSDYPVTIISEEKWSDCRVIEGKFKTPFATYLPGVVRPEVKTAFFQMILPLKWNSKNYKPICIHLAGTGDHYFWRRRSVMAKPLLKDGIGSIILENPYYGLRKPPDQVRSSLHYVSDIFVMGGCLILECLVLLHWCKNRGYGPLGVSGLSMGGHMASLVAANWPEPLVLVPCLSWSTASSVFTEGVMSESIDWDLLQEQYLKTKLYCDKLSKRCKIVDSPFACNLCKIPEYGLEMFLDVENFMNAKYVSPYQMLRVIDDSITHCRAISHKHNRHRRAVVEPVQENMIWSFLKEPIFGPSKAVTDMRKRDKEALWFMRGMMDEFTHLKNFSVPYDTSLITVVCANSDGYVPREGVSHLEDLWPGAKIKYVDTGHVGAYIWHRQLFRDCIKEGFEKAHHKRSALKRKHK